MELIIFCFGDYFANSKTNVSQTLPHALAMFNLLNNQITYPNGFL